MALFGPEILCPYCLQKIQAAELKMACPLCGTTVTPTKGELLLNRIPRCTRTACHKSYASDKKCGHCGTKLPADILDYSKYLRFSILGIAGAGKTNFLTTMLHELRHAIGTPLVLAPMDGDTGAAFQSNDHSVYEAGRPVPATPPGTPPRPQQWKVMDKARMSKTSIPSYSLTIFDGAGEDCEHINPVISRYISGSKALVILIDPLALTGVRDTIDDDILNWSTTTQHDMDASAAMVDGLANYIRQSCNIRPGKLIDRDVAIVFTKIDAVRSSFSNATVMQPSPHLGKKAFVKADSDAVDAEIRDWLISHGESAFLNAIETNFRADKIRFFGVSSFGQPPTGNAQLGKVVPHRVLDPLMWMFSREGILPVI